MQPSLPCGQSVDILSGWSHSTVKLDSDSDLKVALIQYLVWHGARVNQARCTDGWTPLLLAAVFNITSVLSPLLSLGAETSVKDSKGRTVASLGDLVKQYRLNSVVISEIVKGQQNVSDYQRVKTS